MAKKICDDFANFPCVALLDLGTREAVDIVLHRVGRKETIRRLARGVYDDPTEHPAFGSLQPSIEAVAKALAGRDRTRLQPAGA